MPVIFHTLSLSYLNTTCYRIECHNLEIAEQQNQIVSNPILRHHSAIIT